MKNENNPRPETIHKYLDATLEIYHLTKNEWAAIKLNNYARSARLSKVYFPRLIGWGVLRKRRHSRGAVYHWNDTEPTKEHVRDWLAIINKENTQLLRNKRKAMKTNYTPRKQTIVKAVTFIREVRALTLKRSNVAMRSLVTSLHVSTVLPYSLERLGYLKRDGKYYEWSNEDKKTDYDIAVEILTDADRSKNRKTNKRVGNVEKTVLTSPKSVTEKRPTSVNTKTSTPPVNTKTRRLKLFGITIYEYQSEN